MALGRFGSLFPSGEDNVKEGESLLLMLLGFHSFCYDTTPFSKFKRVSRPKKELVCKQCIWECLSVLDLIWRGASIVLKGLRKGGWKEASLARTGH